LNQVRDLDYLGIKVAHWIKFFKTISENKTSQEIEEKLDSILATISLELRATERSPEYKEIFGEIVERLQEFQRKLP